MKGLILNTAQKTATVHEIPTPVPSPKSLLVRAQFIALDPVLPASPSARSFATSFYQYLSSNPGLEPNPVRLMPGGLEKVVEDGFTLLGPGSMNDRNKSRTEPWMKPISMEKLVYQGCGKERA